MDTVRLIDAVVRHTTAFIAQLSTSAGLRAPLAHIADQVFLDLSREIEAQGVSRKVVASMFGMALRGYQRKVQRLSESSTVKGRTLWEAIVDHLDRKGSATRTELMRQFEPDGVEHVGAVLHDLIDSGVAYCTGRGDAAVFGLSSPRDRERILMETTGQRLRMAIWYSIHRGPKTYADVRASVGAGAQETGALLRSLIDDELVRATEPAGERTDSPAQGDDREEFADATLLESKRFSIPVGAEAGWEVAVFDHYRAVLDAIAAKLRSRTRGVDVTRWVGGSTLVFDLYPSHPMKDEVTGLLERVRRDVNEVWDRVSAYNRTHPIPADEEVPLTFYFGQNVDAETLGATHA